MTTTYSNYVAEVYGDSYVASIKRGSVNLTRDRAKAATVNAGNESEALDKFARKFKSLPPFRVIAA